MTKLPLSPCLFPDSMDNQMSMDTSSPMSGSSNMSIPSPADIKPDISQIQVSVSTSQQGYSSGPMSSQQGYPQPQQQQVFQVSSH